MKIFRCQSCGQVVYFENTHCMNCGTVLGFLPDRFLLSGLEAVGNDLWRPLASQADGRLYRMCRNYSGEQVCNWMVSEYRQSIFCGACRFNQTIPDLTIPGNKALWQRLETAKHRLIYSLLRLGLPLIGKREDPETGLAFAFLADPDPLFAESARTMTGHQHGLITINIAEADDVQRERTRQSLTEPYGPCWDISATSADIITGIVWHASRGGWRSSDNYSATSGVTTPGRCSTTTNRERPLTGSLVS